MGNEPRIYVASLSDYNAGRLHGVWIEVDANKDGEDIAEEIGEMLKASTEPIAEEWAVHDYDDWGGLDLGEYPDLEEVARVGALLADFGDAFAAFALVEGIEYATEDRFEEAYRGEWNNERDYAENFADDIGMLRDVDEQLARYFDWDAWTRDLFLGDLYSVPNGMSVYVFQRT